MSARSEIRYSLTEAELLNFQMYTAGASAAIRQHILVGRLVVPLICAGFAAYYAFGSGFVLAGAFLAVALLFALGMPQAIKRRHQRHFREHIREKCQSLLGAEMALIIESEGLRSTGTESDGLIPYSGIESLSELEAMFLIKLKQSFTMIVPKSCLSEPELRAFIELIAEKCALPLQDHRRELWAEACVA
ncbi:YcxB family protein [Coraliomargarita sp. W4R72]